MRWTRRARARLAKMIWERSVQIDNEVRSRSAGLLRYMGDRDSRIPDYFEALGFNRARADEWCFDPSYNHPPLFKPGRSHLFFLVCNQVVLKVHKDKAAKMLVLGLP